MTVPIPQSQFVDGMGRGTVPLIAWMNGVNKSLATLVYPQVNVSTYGAKGDGVTDDTEAIQAAIDENQTSEIWFPHGTYLCSSAILLTDTNGHNFQGALVGQNATLTFSNAGNAADTDAAMQNGLQAYPTLNSSGGDISGMNDVILRGLSIVGPLHGAGLRLANSIKTTIENCKFSENRYGVAQECSIETRYAWCYFQDSKNAGIGFICSSNASIWYASGSPTTTYWNDSPLVMGCGFSNNDLTQGLAHILDHGSKSESVRTFISNFFYSNISGGGAFTSTQYGYLGRSCNPVFQGNWFENINYPVRVLTTNANEGGGNITGVAGAEPAGTYPMTDIPDGFSYAGRFTGNQFFRGLIDLNLTGFTGGPCYVGQNQSGLMQAGGVHLYSIEAGSQMIVDAGDTVFAPVGAYSYKSLTFEQYTNLAAEWVTYSPTVSAGSGTITTSTVNAAKYLRRAHDVLIRLDVTIVTNGTGAGYVDITLPFAVAGNGSVIVGRETVTTGFILQGRCLTNSVRVYFGDNTYPAVSGSRLLLSGVYEAA